MVGFAALRARRLHLGLALAALLPVAARAQQLPVLHISVLGMHADKAVVTPGEAFHVTVHVHVREKRDRLDELVLPALTNVVDLGDERKRVVAPDGTDFYETLTVAANVVGTASFTPAYIDAIDPATGRGMRYSSQPLSVNVVPGTGVADADPGALRRLLLEAVAVVAGVVVLAIAGIVALVRRRGRQRVKPVATVRPQAAVTSVPRAAGLRAAYLRYRAEGDDDALDALRTLLFARAGASAGATLADALDALGVRDTELARLMAVAERARFGPLAERERARADLLAMLEAYVREREPVA